MNKEWRDVVGYEGIYMVSNTGEIKKFNGVVLSPFDSGEGYLCIKLTKNKKRKQKKIHRAVAEAFLISCSEKIEVNHINGIKNDNRIENLEWVTKKQNIKHTYSTLGRKGWWLGAKGDKSPLKKSVYSISMTDGSKQLFSYIGEAVSFGFNSGAISQCCQGKTKSHKGRFWFYVEAQS